MSNRKHKSTYGEALKRKILKAKFFRNASDQTRTGGGPKQKRYLDAGEMIGDLMVAGAYIGPRGGVIAYSVLCPCGGSPWPVLPDLLLSGKTESCKSCAIEKTAQTRRENSAYANKTENLKLRKLLIQRIGKIFSRCFNKTTQNYKYYGGRGITVHPEWQKDRSKMLDYLLALRGVDDPDNEIDRIDTNENYAPGNLRFVSKNVNHKNRRNIKKLQAQSNELNLAIKEARKILKSLKDEYARLQNR